MWLILESKKTVKQLKKCPKNILQEYETWKLVIENDGPMAVRAISGYRDHLLKGEWQGARSSYLNIQWRVIYYIDKNKIQVNVLEVNPHDYRKKT